MRALGGPAHAEKRVALVIGNSAYENVGRLGNPANDAAAMTATLQPAGFDVVESQPTMHGSRPNKMRRTTRPRITACVRRSGRLFEQLATDQHAPNLAGAGADFIQLGVA